jgi:hypothetical protein
MGQAQDPRLKQAQTLQDIEQEMGQMGLEPGTPEFTKTLGQLMMTRLGPAAAAQAVSMARQLEIQRAEVEGIRQGPLQAQARAQGMMRILTGRLKYEPEDAAALIADPELASAVIKEGLKPETLTEKARNYQMALGEGYQGNFMQFMKDTKPAGTTVNVGGKTLSLPERNTLRTADGKPVPPGTTIEQANEGLQDGTLIQKTPAEMASEVTGANEKARLDEASKTLPKAVEDYEVAASNPSASIPGTEAYEIAQAAKGDLAVTIAIIESRGAEPGNQKVGEVKTRIPDFAGIIDRPRFKSKMRAFKQRRGLAEGKLRVYNPKTGELE